MKKEKDSVNSRASSAANLVNADGFVEFMKGVENYGVGAQFTIPDALGEYVSELKQRNVSLVTLGKLIRNNVENGNISGLEPLQTMEGSAKKYRVTGPVKLKRYFSTDWTDEIENLFMEPGEDYSFDPRVAYVFCTYEKKRDSDEVILKVRVNIPDDGEVFDYSYKKKLGRCGFSEIENNNSEFPAIQSVWYGFDRLAELQQNGELEEIDSIIMVGTNNQMMRRVAGCAFGEANNKYQYTQYIQDNFFQFLPGELREIPYNIYLASADKSKLDEMMRTGGEKHE